ncbi:MAG: hypothetical protein KatS3mg114_0682 [Planctomycetaceae bacterium]|nr:MAG: hypothetical protein KatS3mg114_0682 [Planctomycetaceae bacterium]
MLRAVAILEVNAEQRQAAIEMEPEPVSKILDGSRLLPIS